MTDKTLINKTNNKIIPTQLQILIQIVIVIVIKIKEYLISFQMLFLISLISLDNHNLIPWVIFNKDRVEEDSKLIFILLANIKFKNYFKYYL